MTDISLPISDTLAVWPGDPPVLVEPVSRLEAGDGAAVSRLVLGTHTGTHVDPPAHFVAGGATVDELSLEVLIGPAVVAALPGDRPIDGARLEALALPAGTERLLLQTGAGRPGVRSTGFLTPEGAEWLVARGVRLVGADTLSIEPDSDGYPVHRILLGAGVVIVEGLDLTAVAPGRHQLVCLPLRIAGGDGAPARAVLLALPGEAPA